MANGELGSWAVCSPISCMSTSSQAVADYPLLHLICFSLYIIQYALHPTHDVQTVADLQHEV
jgi:hypothetical protein